MIGGVEAVGHASPAVVLELAERAGEGMAGTDEAAWSRRVEADFDNFRAAHAWAVRNRRRRCRPASGRRAPRVRVPKDPLRADELGRDAQRCSPVPLEHPRYPVVLATVAYGHFVRGELAKAIEVGHQAVAAELGLRQQRPRRTDPRQRPVLPRARTDEALGWMDQMVASARAGGSPARLAHALYMRSVAETSVGGPCAAPSSPAKRTPRPARAARPPRRHKPTTPSDWPSKGPNPPRACNSSARPPSPRRAAGNRWVEAFAATEVWWLEARTGELRQALAGSGAVIDTWHRGGDWANLWLSLRHVFGILQQIGDDRAAAVLHGALIAAGATDALPFEPSDAEHLTDIVEQLRARMGPETFERAAADGATMPEPELIAYIQERITDLMSNDQRLESRATVRVERPEATFADP